MTTMYLGDNYVLDMSCIVNMESLAINVGCIVASTDYTIIYVDCIVANACLRCGYQCQAGALGA